MPAGTAPESVRMQPLAPSEIGAAAPRAGTNQAEFERVRIIGVAVGTSAGIERVLDGRVCSMCQLADAEYPVSMDAVL